MLNECGWLWLAVASTTLAEAGTAANMPRAPRSTSHAWNRCSRPRAGDAAAATDRSRRVAEPRRRASQGDRSQLRLTGCGGPSPRWPAVAGSGGSQTAATLSFAAAGYYRGGQLDKAASRSTRQLAKRDEQQANPPSSGLFRGDDRKERGNFREAVDRYRRLGLDFKADERSLPLTCSPCIARTLAQASSDPARRVRGSAKEHVATWPHSETASQAFSRLGRLAEHRAIGPRRSAFSGKYGRAIRNTLKPLPRWVAAEPLAELHARGQDGRKLADDALARWNALPVAMTAAASPQAQHKPPMRASRDAGGRADLARGAPTGRTGRAAATRRARIRSVGTGAWKAEARQRLVPALAMQSKGGQADQVIDQLRARPRNRPALLETLAAVRAASTTPAASWQSWNLRSRMPCSSGETNSTATLRASAPPPCGSHWPKPAGSRQGLRSCKPWRAVSARWPNARRPGRTADDRQRRRRAGGALPNGPKSRKSRPGTPRWFRAHYGLAETQRKLGQPTEVRATINRWQIASPELGGPEMKQRSSGWPKKRATANRAARRRIGLLSNQQPSSPLSLATRSLADGKIPNFGPSIFFEKEDDEIEPGLLLESVASQAQTANTRPIEPKLQPK